MCPVCIATAVLVAGGVAAVGGLAAAAVKNPGAKNATVTRSAPAQSKEDHAG